ncbi:GspE/PulE family protein [Methylophaga sp.]|uniref:GspE/PulE family protein n=1 Tax=Methylophaga sp. TaxID=2024840 RepID=UPI003F69DABD
MSQYSRANQENHAQQRFGRRLREYILGDFRQLFAKNEDYNDDEGLGADALLRDAVKARATDIHLDPFPTHYQIRLRIDGVMIDAIEIEIEQGQRLVNQFKVLTNIDPVPSVCCDEGSFSYEIDDQALDLRLTAVPCVSGDKLALRLLSPPEAVKEVKQLGIHDQGAESIRRWMDATGGMFVVAGPTGSGKTTTLYALLHELKLNDSHVITLEDPVEYEVPGINQIQVNPIQNLTFANGTDAMLRLDPDYVLIGEIRDEPSAQAAISIATSGRAVMATLHSRDAVGTITALRNLGLDDYEISSNLGLVAAQRLVRMLCTDCKVQDTPNDLETRWLEEHGREVPAQIWRAEGCSACNELGFRGRIGIFEVWQPTEQDFTMILNHEDEHALRRTLIKRGHPLMLDDGLAKVEKGLTTLRELLHTGTLLPGYKPE